MNFRGSWRAVVSSRFAVEHDYRKAQPTERKQHGTTTSAWKMSGKHFPSGAKTSTDYVMKQYSHYGVSLNYSGKTIRLFKIKSISLTLTKVDEI